MTAPNFRRALVDGVERVTAWSGLLDRINVFPVPDGDTGRNLIISLAPLRRIDTNSEDVAEDLLFSARGNAGNIAARFFDAFIRANTPEKFPAAIQKGRDQAWRAVGDPQPGTMLTFFDGLAEVVCEAPAAADTAWVEGIMAHLVSVVRETPERQPRLKEAGVVDAGALGMLLFFDGFFNSLIGNAETFCPVAALFGDQLHLHGAEAAVAPEPGYCVDMVLSPGETLEAEMASLAEIGESLVVIRKGAYVKVHLHTPDRAEARRSLEKFGDVVRWSEDDLSAQMATFRDSQGAQAIHVMTDAAGSLTRDVARQFEITLLDSYISLGDTSLPESCLTPGTLYGAMKKRTPASTSQSSVRERHQAYQGALSLYGKVLYLCVGSVYTGNYQTALQWKADHDPENALTVVDTGCAAGRLGLLAAMTAEFSRRTTDPDEVIAFAEKAVARCHEYLFVDRLHYLAVGGRLSKTGAFVGDLLHMKPVISPQADGAQKVGMVRNRQDQITFALDKLGEVLPKDSRSAIWLEYTDNGDWVRQSVRPEIEKRYPLAEIAVTPLSLTTGVHTGPGTWGMAFFAD
ncbi:MAG: DegV family protein [Syntrophales bacterium]|nr:DegV family protein [Syntrophales bacterium]